MPDRLELTSTAWTSRAVSFMNLMRDPAFHKRFEADPAGTAMREFHLKATASAISTSNQLLASLLKDQAFNKWCADFQARVEREHPELAKSANLKELAKQAKAVTAGIQREFADGVVDHLPADVRSKIRANRQWINKGQIAAEDDIAILLLVFVAIVVVVVAPRERGDLLSRNTVRLLINQLDTMKREIGGGA